jgi:monoamine oxidase
MMDRQWGLSRRRFLATSAACLAPGWLGYRPAENRARGVAKRVVVVGQGLSGLATCLALRNAGFDVTGLEADDRVGGRVRTMRNLVEGQAIEVGAMFVLRGHHRTRALALELGVSLAPAFPERSCYGFVSQRTLVCESALRIGPAQRGVTDLWAHYVDAYLDQLESDTERWSDSLVGDLVGVSFDEWLRRRVPDPEEVRWLSLGLSTQFGRDLACVSAFQVLRDRQRRRVHSPADVVVGGTETLVDRLVDKVRARGVEIRLGAPVVSIHQDDNTVSVRVRPNRSTAEPEVIESDFVVLTAPLGVINRIEFLPGFSLPKNAALSFIEMTPVTRLYCEFETDWWNADERRRRIDVDSPLRSLIDVSAASGGQGNVLEAYVTGPDAIELDRVDSAKLPELWRELIQLCLNEAPPPVRVHRFSWQRPWIGGGYIRVPAGAPQTYRRDLAMPHGRVHFAGEHTSPDAAWMEGALESAARVVQEICDAERGHNGTNSRI